ncbi:MAG: hypothetical protein RLZZ224_1473, partial [Verrucomicrobiota bacterium]
MYRVFCHGRTRSSVDKNPAKAQTFLLQSGKGFSAILLNQKSIPVFSNEDYLLQLLTEAGV